MLINLFDTAFVHRRSDVCLKPFYFPVLKLISRRPSPCRPLGFFILFSIISLVSGIAIAAPGSIGILYPDVPEPYQNIFLDVMAGIDNTAIGTVQNYRLDSNYDTKAVRAWLKEKGIDVIIALGRRGLNAATAATDKLPIVSGALLLNPDDERDNMAGISLAADPKALFEKLLSLLPTIERIHVVYDPDQNAWMIEMAQKEAAALNIELVAEKASSLREAAFKYNKMLHTADPKKDALWLPIDSTTVNDQVILPLILRDAWDDGLAVFSSNPTHASKGALFSVFPDNQALGHSLALLARQMKTGHDSKRREVRPLEDLKFAINRRTAEHLGLGFTAERRQKFDYVFPAR